MGPINLGWIDSIFYQWQFENDEKCAQDKRHKRQYFIRISNIDAIPTNSNFPSPTDLVFGASCLHIIILIGSKHYAYVKVGMLGCAMEYWDSNQYDNRRTTKNAAKRNGEVIMEKIESFLNVEGAKNTKSIEYYKKVIEKRATQFNDIDCGVFALFYVECCVNEIVVKPSLSNEEIENYRVQLFAITERRKILQKQLASKNRTETETFDLT